MTLSPNSVFRFGPFEVHPISGELRKHGLKIRLQQQPFQVLLALLEQPGQIVTRESLRQQLWATDTFVDFEHGLNAAIGRLREALCDSAATPRFVETVPKRGYRFLALVESSGGAHHPVARTMLAVLPFENLSPDPEQEFFVDGMTEEMIAQLGRLNPVQLGVIARTSAMQYKGNNKTVEQIGRELGVEYLLAGSVRRAGSRVRITSQLIRVSDQTQLWAESFDRVLEDVLTIQAECASRTAAALALELLPAQSSAAQGVSPRVSDAYVSYLRGRYFWSKHSSDSLHQAIEHFKLAAAQDPENPLPYAGLGDAFIILGIYGYVPPSEAFDQADRAARKALALDPLRAEAHISLAYSTFLYHWNWAEAEREFRLGLSLNPNYVVGHYWYAVFLAAMGRFDEALVQIKEAYALDPVSAVVHLHHGYVCYFARQFAQAIECCRKALELDPDFWLPNGFLGLSQLQLGQAAEAVAALEKCGLESSDNAGALGSLVCAYAAVGRAADALRLYSNLKNRFSSGYVSPFMLAVATIGLGRREEAIDWLEKAYEERSFWLVNMNVDPARDILANHPRFRKLLHRMGLQS